MDKFVSDTHLGHENILTFERKQFRNIEEHDTFIKNLIQQNVSRHDTLYVLGDVGDLNEENIQFWKSLPCHTILIRGNHDTQKGKCEQAFDIVSDVPIFYKKRILLSHEPLPVTSETLNVHGHLHMAKLDSPNHLNLSIHVAGYKIWTAKELETIIARMPKISQRFMFEWYADKYQFMGEKKDVSFNDDGTINLAKSRKNQLCTPHMKEKIRKTLDELAQRHPNKSRTFLRRKIRTFMISQYPTNANFQPSDISLK